MRPAITRLSLALLAALALAHSGVSGGPRIAPTTAQPAAVVLVDSDVLGTGRWWARAICIGCIGAAFASGGASIVGLAVLVAANPGITGFCIGACLT